MPNARVNREKKIRETKINLILDAARTVFSENGFEATRLEDIAAYAGFSKASLYNYYGDKEDIFISLAIREYTKLINKIKLDTNLSLPLKENLKIILVSIFSVFGDHFAIFLTISNYMAMKIMNSPPLSNKNEKQVEEFKNVFDELIEIIVVLIESARKQGEIRSPLTSRILSKNFGSLIKGILFEWKLIGKMGNIEEAVNDILSFAEQGFGMLIPQSEGLEK